MATTDLIGALGRADNAGDTAPLPPAAIDVARRLELELRSPVDVLRMRVGRLEESLWIQRQGRDFDLVQMRNPALSELERAEAEGSFRSTAWEIVDLRRQLREAKAALEVAIRFQEAESTYRLMSAQTSRIAPGEFDRLLCLQDEMRMCRCQLEAAGRLDLIGGAA
ncbi:hypothetical protein [Streptomyces sp. NPDC050416]|uniref:hypothetical protein n=1 Tax=Streptomyces sp. NPDC050416 TaxID=3365611 RepID=UPI0037A7A92A